MTTEELRLRQKIKQRFNKGVAKYRLIEDGDKVLIALSGGKDSMAMLELLAARSKVFKPRFSVIATHITLENIPYRSDVAYLRHFSESHDVPFIHYATTFDDTTDTRKSPCFLCSWNRRKALFTIAQEQGCNKIALGHHMDDILETLLMNITFQGAFSTMPPLLQMRKFDVAIIRPLCLVHEADLIAFAALQHYQEQEKRCPHEHTSHRSDIKQLLHQLETLNPEARYSLWGSMTNVQTDLLPNSI